MDDENEADMSDTARQEKNAKVQKRMATAEISDTARQEKNAKVQKRMATAEISDAARQEKNTKAQRRMAKTRADMSDTARQEENSKLRNRKAKARAEMSDAARQEGNAKLRNRKATAEMSGVARQEENAKRRNRKAKARAEMSDAARQEENAKLRNRKARAGMSDAVRQEENAKLRNRKARAEMSDAARQEENAKLRNRKAKARAEMSDVARQEENAKLRNRKAKARAEMSDATSWKGMVTPETVTRDGRAQARAQRSAIAPDVHRTVRKAKKNDALRGKDILDGICEVLALEHSDDSIGKLGDAMCHGCGAHHFSGETSRTCCAWKCPCSSRGSWHCGCDDTCDADKNDFGCCAHGKVHLPIFPDPPVLLHNLWFSNSPEACLFRRHCRSINNAVCLTSIKVKERKFRSGFNPSVIFESKVLQFCGPLQADVGERPVFAQLYVHDSNLETNQRFANMSVPASLSQHKKQLLKGVLQTVQDILHQQNPFVLDFQQILEIPDEQLEHGCIVIDAKARPAGQHTRRYNAPTNLREISILTNCEPHDLVLRKRGGGPRTISDLNPKAMPLHFTLLFPLGTYSWDQYTKHSDGVRRVTPREFYVFHLNKRNGPGDYLLRAGRLLQEWICMAWVTAENQKVQYQRYNQQALRADSFKNVKEMTEERRQHLAPVQDRMHSDDHQPQKMGRNILSSSYIGSPRWYNAQFQDAMAICREFHKPDYFITMTCNPQWPEISSQLGETQTLQDRPDIVARVFKERKDRLLHDLTVAHVLGRTVAHLWVIEFQKRGLPHAHILIILDNHAITATPDQVDSIVCSELPPDPAATDDPEIKARRQTLQNIVVTSMIHGPCGAANPLSPCMENGRCTKGFPKEFQPRTIMDTSNSYPVYRRRHPDDGGRKITNPTTGRQIDNSWVVPYSPILSLRYNCHINVEVCVSPTAAKYLYKYVTKGPDRAMVSAEVDGQQVAAPTDEIQQYEDLRSVGSSEATWHLMAFPIAKKHPAVYALRIHLEEEQQVVFNEGDEENALERQRNTELTAFFHFNKTATDKHMYVDMPKYCTYSYNKETEKKVWKVRRFACGTIGRVHTVHPLAGEVFYLRMLLHNDHCRGKECFTGMRTLPNGHVCDTY